MASPFKVFRRHQKEALAVLGVMIMLAFTVGPIITSMNKSSGRTDAVVVASRYGDLRESDLYFMRQQHFVVANFLTRALLEVGPERANPQWYAFQKQMMTVYLPGRSAQEIEAVIQQNWQRMVQGMVEEAVGPSTEQALADNWLLAKRARELGIVVSDKSVIAELSQRVIGLPQERVKQIIDSLNVGQHQLIEAFRSHLLADRLRRMFFMSMAASPPAERWENYQKLHRQATIEAAVVPVASFVAKVADPDEKTLAQYFERYKDRPFDPTSPEPGFREPYRTTVEYFKAEYDKFVDPKAVTDAEIAKYYEDHKSEYIKRELPKPEEPAKPAPKPEAQKPAEPTKAAPAPSPKAEPAKAPPAVKSEPPKDKPAVKAEAPKPQPTAKPAEPAKDKPAAKGKTSSLWRSTRISLAAFEKETEKAPSAKPAESKPADAKPANAKPAEQKPAESKPAATETKPAAQKPAGATPVAKPEAPPQYTPLAEVRNQIRDRLAQEQAAKKMRAVLEPIRDQLRRFSAQLARAKGKNEELPKFDAAAVAKANGLVVKRLEMVSERDLAGVDIFGAQTTDQQTFEQHVFRTPGLGRPTVAQDLERNMYLFWKADDKKEHVPKLDDPGVRARVVAAWKLAQAYDLAKAEADRLAAKARQSKAPLKESLKAESSVKVLEPKPFSWLTRGQVPLEMSDRGPPKYSRVEGLNEAGAAFMQTVFRMEPGTVAVTTNMPKNELIVVRADQFSPSTNVLWELFIHEDYGRYASAAWENQRALYRSWLDEVKDTAAFQWKRTPDQRDENAGPVGRPEPLEAPQF